MENRVLVIEDDPGLRAIYKNVLARTGLQVFEATNGEDAINQLTQYTPFMIVLDVLMPIRSGRDVLDFIHAHPHLYDSYIVIASAHSGFSELAQEVPHGEFLLKPILPADIRAAAERALDREHGDAQR